MIVEPNAGDKLEDNLHPIGRAFYGAPHAVHAGIAFAGSGLALGAQAGERGCER